MTEKEHTKLIHEGDYVAEVRIAVEHSDGPWAPYVSPGEAMKLDLVRLALRENDINTAAKYGKVYRVSLVAGRFEGATRPRRTIERDDDSSSSRL